MYYKRTFIIYVLLLLIATTPFNVNAGTKSDKRKPVWVKNTPKALNDSYSFKVVVVDNGQTLSGSRLLARAELTRYIQKEFNIQVSEELTNESETTQHNDNPDYKDKEIYTYNVKSDEEKVAINCERVDEYYEIYEEEGVRIFKLYTLFAVSNGKKDVVSDEFRLTEKYGFSARALVPGWAQIHKGSMGKGITIIATEVVAVGGIIYTENMRAAYKSLAQSQPRYAKEYSLRANNFEIARNCCIGAAAAIYVYNLIDAIVAPGARRVIVKPRKIQFGTTASNDFCGMSLSYNF